MDSKNYIQSLTNLSKEREKYKLRNDAHRYLRLGEQELYERVAPLSQKPVTEKLEEVKQVLQQNNQKTHIIQPQIPTKVSYEPLEVFDKIIDEISKLPILLRPATSVRLGKSNEGYVLGKTPIEVDFHDQGRDIVVGNYRMPFSEDLEQLLQMQKVSENGEELKQFKMNTIQDYINLLEHTKNPACKITGNYKQAVRILKNDPPSYRIGKGLDNDDDGKRVLTLLAAKSEGHNNVDNELKQLLS